MEEFLYLNRLQGMKTKNLTITLLGSLLLCAACADDERRENTLVGSTGDLTGETGSDEETGEGTESSETGDAGSETGSDEETGETGDTSETGSEEDTGSEETGETGGIDELPKEGELCNPHILVDNEEPACEFGTYCNYGGFDEDLGGMYWTCQQINPMVTGNTYESCLPDVVFPLGQPQGRCKFGWCVADSELPQEFQAGTVPNDGACMPYCNAFFNDCGFGLNCHAITVPENLADYVLETGVIGICKA